MVAPISVLNMAQQLMAHDHLNIMHDDVPDEMTTYDPRLHNFREHMLLYGDRQANNNLKILVDDSIMGLNSADINQEA